MARIDSLANFLEDIATKIRSKTGSQSTITPANYDTEIEKIKWVAPAGTKLCFNSIFSVANLTRPDNTTTSVNLKNIDTSNITHMRCMFKFCTALTALDLSSFDTSNVIDMREMFSGCTLLSNINLSSFDTSELIEAQVMFSGCTNLETINFGNNFTLDSITNINNMFGSCTKLDNNTLNSILHICTTVGNNYTSDKTLAKMGITDTFDNFANIPNLSNYQEFIDAGWTIS